MPNKAEQEGKQHRAEGKPISSGKYNTWFPTESQKQKKVDFDNAWREEDKRRSEKDKNAKQ